MLDLIYVTATVSFFALMLGYVALCQKLGRSAETAETSSESRA
jgi:hypothetical protein